LDSIRIRDQPVLTQLFDRSQSLLYRTCKPVFGIARLCFQGVTENDFVHDRFIVAVTSEKSALIER
jgi:hypothetical protein